MRRLFLALLCACGVSLGQAEDLEDAPPPSEAPAAAPIAPDAGIEDASAVLAVDDATIDASGPPDAATNAFTGAPAYVAQTGRPAPHELKDATEQTCMSADCHDGSNDHATKYSAAGMVLRGDFTTTGAGIEVRIRRADGTALSAFTDSRGFFFFEEALSLPAMVGVRDAMSMRVMVASAGEGNCNACHGTLSTIVHLP